MKTLAKKLTILLMSLSLCAALVACGGGNNSSQQNSTGNNGQNTSDSGEGDTTAETAFVFQSNGVDIAMNAPADDVVEALGEPISTFEAPSCAFQGTDWTYTYDGFQVNTYPLDDVNYISSVVLTSDAVSTPEGLEIGGTLENMVAAYGEDYTEEYGQYTYTRGDSQLSVLIEDGAITSIEYLAVLPE